MTPQVKPSKIETVRRFVHVILQNRFPGIPAKQQIDPGDNKLNFACPICGDSQKKATKKRGNIYFSTNVYKCFNDGCMAYMSLKQFIATFANQYHISPDSSLFEYDSLDKVVVPKNASKNPLISFLIYPKDNLLSITEMINRFGLTRGDMLPEGSAVRKELERRLVHLTPNYGDYFYGDIMDSKIFIFNLGNRSGKILGFAIRTLDENADRKYIIKTYNDILKVFPDLRIDKDIVEECNSFNNYFNILNLDFSQKITLAEGQIDSCFIRNCIATTGVSKSMHILENLGSKKNLRIIFDRDKAGKTEMIKLINKGFPVFLWSLAIETISKNYNSFEDLKEMIKIKDINNLFMFMIKRQAVTFDSFNEFIDQFFSKSQLDLLFV